ncbi:MAG: IS982 family transposase, partial [Mucilaginibacter sp.]
MLTPDKIIEIFVKVDDFCKECETEIAEHRLDAGNYKIRDRKASLADSEIITILVAFHSGHFTNLKHFYVAHICMYYKDYFPGLVSYNRFVELQQRVAVPMMLFLKTSCLGRSRGIN